MDTGLQCQCRMNIPTARAGETGCAVTDVLVFCCGAERISHLDLGSTLRLYSSTKMESWPLQALDIILRLPTLHGEDYQSFKEAMIMSLKGNDGFGGV